MPGLNARPTHRPINSHSPLAGHLIDQPHPRRDRGLLPSARTATHNNLLVGNDGCWSLVKALYIGLWRIDS